VALAGFLAAGSAAHADTIAFDFTGGSNTSFFLNQSFTTGYTFTVNTPIDVTQLGVWDPVAGAPLTRNHPVGIWDQAGTLLGSATVLTTSPMTAGFQFVPVTPFELDPGQTYTIGAFYPNTGPDLDADQPLRSNATGFTPAAAVSFGTNRNIFNNAGLTEPNANFPGSNPAFFGPNFQFGPVAPSPPVPEPTTLVLFGLGGLIVLGVARRAAPLLPTLDCGRWDNT
jgi:hypothetical protein